ncbi:Oidioi.mRNA.OKI2018_I69.PAR.g9633.t1.cds [Oikopleura dioica]|uniref:Oidioi.mRNA.OKI2018_I69.PAR.g9633.t1.cds n=1 Tax=Oikopleura dioica TaxID=34765 RepID=A0ABN7RQX3_OIKDI|nr:Oidioi.mRNA.OKI2018_I69.PAR.g9633.t1.cds [Oikopleura dioica]
MIEKLLKITNPLSSSNHGNSPPKIDNSKNVKTTKISSLMSYVTKPPQKKRTIIAIPLKPKQKEETSKLPEIKEEKKLQEKIEVKKIETKSDNSDSLLDKNSDKSLDDLSIPEISISSGSSVSSICDSPITVTPKSQPKKIQNSTSRKSDSKCAVSSSLESSSSAENSSLSTSSNPSSSSPSPLQKSTNQTVQASSGYGSEGYVSENSTKSQFENAKRIIVPIVAKVTPAPAKPAIELNKTHVIPKIEKKSSFLAAKPFLTNKVEPKFVDIRDEKSHCARCHKSFNPNSSSNAEMRCLLPHPTNMVIALGRDQNGTNFVCLCCRTEFKLPKMTFYEAGVNSMLTGYCFRGQHTSKSKSIDYQDKGGAALSCEEAGCIEFFV